MALLLAGLPLGAEEPPPPELPLVHVHPSRRFRFRTPADWRVGGSTGRPAGIEATDGKGLIVRYLFYDGEQGYDSLHVTCMMERLAPENEQSPHVEYEHDFLSGTWGSMRVLDSTFVITYDQEIQGHRRWHQRNVTLVGQGLSLCAISYAPEKVWKKDARARALLDAVLTSVEFVDPKASAGGATR